MQRSSERSARIESLSSSPFVRPCWYGVPCLIYTKYDIMPPTRAAPKLTRKGVRFIGGSLEALRAFPAEVRRALGTDLDAVQAGETPSNWDSFTEVGPGTMELRQKDSDGWYRVMYVAKFEEAVYVLHAFQKKTNRTSRQDVDAGIKRYKEMLEKRKSS